MRRLAAASILSVVWLGSWVLAEDKKESIGSALVCVDRKCGTGDQIGLWHRTAKGEKKRILECEPYDARLLPDGRCLVAERWKGRVLLLDKDRKVLLEKEDLGTPVDVEEAKDGTIVVVLNEPGEVVGLDPKSGAVRWRRDGFSSPFDAEPLAEGGLLVADSGAGRIVELDKDGKVRREVKDLGFPNTVEALAKGAMLVTTWSRGEVLEIDAAGKTTWRAKPGGTIYRASRRADGRTLAIDGGGRAWLLDDRGAVVHEEKFEPGCVDWEPIDES